MIDVPALTVTGLSVRVDGGADAPLVIVEDLNFSVRAGQLCCIVGRSGSGKTSVLRRIAGLIPPPPGTVDWGGVDASTLTDDEFARFRRGSLAYVDQDAALVQELSVLENVQLPLLPDGRRRVRRSRREAVYILEALGLGDRLQWKPAVLSGGERHRTALARAMIVAPRVLIADEPTASLDRGWAAEVVRILRGHAARGGMVIAASHDPQLAAEADVVVRLEDGAVVADVHRPDSS